MGQDLNSLSGEQMDERKTRSACSSSAVLDLFVSLSFPCLTHSNFGWYLYVPPVAATGPGQCSLFQGVHGLVTGSNGRRGNVSFKAGIGKQYFYGNGFI